MALWILSFCIMAIETWGSIYFFDTFLKKKDMGRLGKCSYVFLYLATVVVAFLGGRFFSMGIKVLATVMLFMAFCAVFYEADWKQRIFFSGLNYSLLFLTDLFMLQMENMFVSDKDVLTFSSPALKNDMALCDFYSTENMERTEQLRGAFP